MDPDATILIDRYHNLPVDWLESSDASTAPALKLAVEYVKTMYRGLQQTKRNLNLISAIVKRGADVVKSLCDSLGSRVPHPPLSREILTLNAINTTGSDSDDDVSTAFYDDLDRLHDIEQILEEAVPVVQAESQYRKPQPDNVRTWSEAVVHLHGILDRLHDSEYEPQEFSWPSYRPVAVAKDISLWATDLSTGNHIDVFKATQSSGGPDELPLDEIQTRCLKLGGDIAYKLRESLDSKYPLSGIPLGVYSQIITCFVWIVSSQISSPGSIAGSDWESLYELMAMLQMGGNVPQAKLAHLDSSIKLPDALLKISRLETGPAGETKMTDTVTVAAPSVKLFSSSIRRFPEPTSEDRSEYVPVELTDGRSIAERQPSPFASGGYADLFQAKYTPWGSRVAVDVALKIFKMVGMNKNSPDYDSVITRTERRLAREISLWKDVHHRHVTPLLAWAQRSAKATPDDLPLLVVPYRRHGDITVYLLKQPNADRLALLKQAASGLCFLHQKGILHMDVKPQNILVNDREEAELCDFGLSRVFDEIPSGNTSANRTPGTLAYMAPELIMSDDDDSAVSNSSQGPGADIYAFGMVILEVMSGVPPFRNANHWTLALRIQSGKRPSEQDHPFKLPAPESRVLWKLIKDCWNQSLDERPDSFAMLSALEQIHRDHIESRYP